MIEGLCVVSSDLRLLSYDFNLLPQLFDDLSQLLGVVKALLVLQNTLQQLYCFDLASQVHRVFALRLVELCVVYAHDCHNVLGDLAE